MCMRLSDEKIRRITSDLGLKIQFVKGQDIPVKNCWHFCTDGNAVDAIFSTDEDFRAGMNRIYKLSTNYDIVILAFCLMDTHVHFILYGDFEECNRFLHEYVRLTSYHISREHSDRNKMMDVPIRHQEIDTDWYLKKAVCYVIKNPPAGGLPYTYYDYPWSSGALYFRNPGHWASPTFYLSGKNSIHSLSNTSQKRMLNSHFPSRDDAKIIDGIVFPGEYVAVEVVEQLFRSVKGFTWFIGTSKESDVESREGAVSYLSIPIQEMRQHKNEMCRSMFAVNDIRSLNTDRRLALAKALRSKYNSSLKQICRLCGLQYNEVKGLF